MSRFTYFLDESGTTGDLARNAAQGFGGQRVFALTGVRIDDVEELQRVLADLVKSYKVQGVELKSASIVRKPGLISELIAYLRERQLPVFIEVVDKRYFVLAMMINHLMRVPQQANFFPVRATMAEALAEVIPDDLLFRYCQACNAPVRAQLLSILEGLVDIGANMPDVVGEGIRRFSQYAINELEELPEAESLKEFLPIPDTGKKGQTYWMLPELTSLTNIYARLNRFHRGVLGDVTLTHDAHAHLDDILDAAMRAAEGLAGQGTEMVLPFADYRIRQKAKLQFGDSTQHPGIQVADLLAGFVMRYVQGGLVSDAGEDPVRDRVMAEILGLTNRQAAVGVNFVLSSTDLDRMGLPY